MTLLHTKLFALQELDSQLIHGQARLNAIGKALQEPQEMTTLRTQIDSTRERIAKIQATITDTELQIGSIQSKYSKSTDLLYSGKVKNPKELEDLEAEIKSLTRRQSDVEETLLIQMEELDEYEGIESEAKDKLQELTDNHADLTSRLTEEQEGLAGALKKLMVQRKGMVTDIDKPILIKYQKLLQAKNGVGVVKVKQNSCQGCHVSIPAGLTRKVEQGGLETCPSCGRIMVSP